MSNKNIILEELNSLIYNYIDNAKDNPYKPDLYEIKEFIQKEVKKLNIKNDMGTTSMCWLSTRIYFKSPKGICNYTNNDILKLLDLKAIEFFKENYPLEIKHDST